MKFKDLKIGAYFRRLNVGGSTTYRKMAERLYGRANHEPMRYDHRHRFVYDYEMNEPVEEVEDMKGWPDLDFKGWDLNPRTTIQEAVFALKQHWKAEPGWMKYLLDEIERECGKMAIREIHDMIARKWRVGSWRENT